MLTHTHPHTQVHHRELENESGRAQGGTEEERVRIMYAGRMLFMLFMFFYFYFLFFIFLIFYTNRHKHMQSYHACS